jgi:hypothetical protein
VDVRRQNRSRFAPFIGDRLPSVAGLGSESHAPGPERASTTVVGLMLGLGRNLFLPAATGISPVLAPVSGGILEWQPAPLQSASPQASRNPPGGSIVMKHLLSGTAFAAALVLAAPVWAQTSSPMAPSSPSTAPSASTAAPMEPMGSHKMRSHRTRTGHKMVRHGASRRGTGPNDNIANQLNAQELARSGGGMGGAPAPASGGATGPYGQPNQLQGIPGAGQASPSPNAPAAR